MRFKIVEQFTQNNNEDVEGLVVEAADPTKAYKIKERSKYPIILYGWQYKNEPIVEIEPEEHTKDSIEDRINRIVHSYDKYSYNGNTGHRYAKRSDFSFYILYNGDGYRIGAKDESPNNTTMNESNNHNDEVELYYDDLRIEVYTGSSSGRFDVGYGNWLPDDEYKTEYVSCTYYANKQSVEEFLVDFVEEELSNEQLKALEEMSDNDYQDYLYKYVEDNFDTLLDKHMSEVLDYFEDDAIEQAIEEYEDDYYYESLCEDKKKKKKKSKSVVKSWLGWWQPMCMSMCGKTNHNCGDNDYNNDMFNHMTGADGGEFGSLSSGSGDGAPSTSGDVGGGMGESLNHNNNNKNKRVRL